MIGPTTPTDASSHPLSLAAAADWQAKVPAEFTWAETFFTEAEGALARSSDGPTESWAAPIPHPKLEEEPMGVPESKDEEKIRGLMAQIEAKPELTFLGKASYNLLSNVQGRVLGAAQSTIPHAKLAEILKGLADSCNSDLAAEASDLLDSMGASAVPSRASGSRMAVFSKAHWSEDGTYAHLQLTWQPKGGRPVVGPVMDCSNKLKVTKALAEEASSLVVGELEVRMCVELVQACIQLWYTTRRRPTITEVWLLAQQMRLEWGQSRHRM